MAIADGGGWFHGHTGPVDCVQLNSRVEDQEPVSSSLEMLGAFTVQLQVWRLRSWLALYRGRSLFQPVKLCCVVLLLCTGYPDSPATVTP